MQYRPLGRTGHLASTIGFGAWAIGGTWGKVDDAQSMAALHAAVDAGVNFIDTADVYGDGHSERLVGKLLKERKDPLFVATKAGKRLSPWSADGFNRENLTAWIERSLVNLGVPALDLVQLHCPPTEVYYRPEVFGILDELVKAGKLRHYGVSVEKVEEALKAIEFPGVQTVQLIFNAVRHRPAERFFALARERQVGIIARVPLASGLLTGKMRAQTQFADDDHRAFNRKGEAFDVGETFSGLPYELGLELAEELRKLVPEGVSMAQWALRWILMHEDVTCAIPGARTVAQARDNALAADLPPLAADVMAAVSELYQSKVKQLVHQRW